MRKISGVAIAAAVALTPAYAYADDAALVHVGGRLQPRFTYTGQDGPDEAAFEIARMRVVLDGKVEGFGYKVQADLGKGMVVLKDAYVDVPVQDGEVWLRVGQWKRPFTRQQIVSSGKLELVDRAITDKLFGAGRDIGVAVHDGYEKSPRHEWVVGVFNGTGDAPVFDGSKFSNVPARLRPAFVARAGYNHGAIAGYSEADLEGGPLRAAIGASVQVEPDGFDADEVAVARAEVDGVVKVDGFSATAAIHAGAVGTRLGNLALDAVGVLAQVGYVGDHLGVVARGAYVRFADADDARELTFGPSCYRAGHDLKWQADVGFRSTGDVDEVVIRTQLQLAF